LKDEQGGTIWNSKFAKANTVYEGKTCLNKELCYKLTFLDTSGDGWGDGGHLNILLGDNVVYNGNTLGKGSGFVKELGDCDLDFIPKN